jgi:LmbE family N-acetylglucosaminyl deacetylase
VKPLLPLAVLALSAAAGAAVAADAAPADATAASAAAMPEPGPQDRVLVVSPHPDDDELCCSGYMQRAIARGAQVAIVWMTAGDGFTIDAVLINRHFRESGLGMVQLGRIRISEAVAAARSVGVPLTNLRMLGYPDGGLAALLVTHYDQPFRSPHTRRSVVPYGEAPSFNQDMTGRNVEQDLA